ncbi:hypothetical protein Q3G72_030685 [Acer saccharum]|nr:hypothetical protein Q3G72_030685 [Acer saccharum]
MLLFLDTHLLLARIQLSNGACLSNGVEPGFFARRDRILCGSGPLPSGDLILIRFGPREGSDPWLGSGPIGRSGFVRSMVSLVSSGVACFVFLMAADEIARRWESLSLSDKDRPILQIKGEDQNSSPKYGAWLRALPPEKTVDRKSTGGSSGVHAGEVNSNRTGGHTNLNRDIDFLEHTKNDQRGQIMIPRERNEAYKMKGIVIGSSPDMNPDLAMNSLQGMVDAGITKVGPECFTTAIAGATGGVSEVDRDIVMQVSEEVGITGSVSEIGSDSVVHVSEVDPTTDKLEVNTSSAMHTLERGIKCGGSEMGLAPIAFGIEDGGVKNDKDGRLKQKILACAVSTKGGINLDLKSSVLTKDDLKPKSVSKGMVENSPNDDSNPNGSGSIGNTVSPNKLMTRKWKKAAHSPQMFPISDQLASRQKIREDSKVPRADISCK